MKRVESKLRYNQKLLRKCLQLGMIRQFQAARAQQHDVQSSTAVAADATGQLHVLRHDGDALAMSCARVGVVENLDEVGLGSLLQRQYGRALAAEVLSEILKNLLHQALERQLTDEQVH